MRGRFVLLLILGLFAGVLPVRNACALTPEDLQRSIVKVISKGPPGQPTLASSGWGIHFRGIDREHPKSAYFVLATGHGVYSPGLMSDVRVTDGTSAPVPCELIEWSYATDLAVMHCPRLPAGVLAAEFMDIGKAMRWTYLAHGDPAYEFAVDGSLAGFPSGSDRLHTILLKSVPVRHESEPSPMLHPGLRHQMIVPSEGVVQGMSGGMLIMNEFEDGALPLGMISKRVGAAGDERVVIIPANDVFGGFLGAVRFGRWPGPRKPPSKYNNLEQDADLKGQHPLNVRIKDVTYFMEKTLIGGIERKTVSVIAGPEAMARTLDYAYFASTEYYFGQFSMLAALRANPGCGIRLIGKIASGKKVSEPIGDYESFMASFVRYRSSYFGHKFDHPAVVAAIECPNRADLMKDLVGKVAKFRKRYREMIQEGAMEYQWKLRQMSESYVDAVATEILNSVTGLPGREALSPSQFPTPDGPWEYQRPEDENETAELKEMLKQIRFAVGRLYDLIDEG
jgi:hypothetical protein